MKTKLRNWRIVAGVFALIAAYAFVGKLDSDARLAEAEHFAKLQPRVIVQQAIPLQRQISIGQACGGVL
jgi:hypothetical protein